MSVADATHPLIFEVLHDKVACGASHHPFHSDPLEVKFIVIVLERVSIVVVLGIKVRSSLGK